jgi:hypothetical protein
MHFLSEVGVAMHSFRQQELQIRMVAGIPEAFQTKGKLVAEA